MASNVEQYLEAARRGAEWLISQQNPDGSFVRPDLQADVYHKAPYALAISGHPIEANRLLFLTRLYLAAGGEEYLGTARRLFEFTQHCAEDAYSYPTAGKGAVGAAILFTITSDERAQRAACQFGDYLLREQHPEGWWRNPHSASTIVRLDHTAEFVVWLSEIAATLGGSERAGGLP